MITRTGTTSISTLPRYSCELEYRLLALRIVITNYLYLSKIFVCMCGTGELLFAIDDGIGKMKK